MTTGFDRNRARGKEFNGGRLAEGRKRPGNVTRPVIAVDLEAIFQQEILAGDILSCHPLNKNLENFRSSIEEIPKGLMEITLPISVQAVVNSISITEKRNKNGTKFLVALFSEYQTAYTIK
jgi:hypothetical protein